MAEPQKLLDAMGVLRDAFSGRTAVVTGGAQGIGEATARLLAGRGASVAILDVLEVGARVAAEIRAAGASAVFIRCDVADAAQLEASLDAAAGELGPIDILVNGAGIAQLASIADTTVEDWDRVLAVNVRAPFVAMRRLVPGMIARRRGAVVNMVAMTGTTGVGCNFAVSKEGLRTLGLSIAREVGAEAGVAILSFLPGVVDTPGLRRTIVPGMMAYMGITEEQALAIMARNPGYAGFMPVGDCAAGLVFVLAHAQEYHGQVADPFEPLQRHGLIAFDADQDPRRAPASDLRVDFLGHLAEVTARNRDLERRIALRTRELAEAHARSETLLLNILPPTIAERLKRGKSTIADHFDEVTVLFADLADFTPLSAHLSPERVVDLLDAAFTAFDDISRGLGLEKIKTIGDCYLVVGGMPEPKADHVDAVARAALAFLAALDQVSARADVKLRCRMGMHVGPVVAGVIGKHKFSYDLWGDTVNTASRMESHGVIGRIHCTDAVRARLEGRFRFEERGEIEVKGKGTMRTFFLTADLVARSS